MSHFGPKCRIFSSKKQRITLKQKEKIKNNFNYYTKWKFCIFAPVPFKTAKVEILVETCT